MSRFVSDIIILVAIILGVRVIAEGEFDGSSLVSAVTNLSWPDLAFAIDPRSLAIGFIGGVAAGCLANVQWSQIPDRAKRWFSNHSSRLSYVAVSLGFAVVLFYH